MTRPKLLQNGNTWPTVITTLLTLILAGISYLSVMINVVNGKVDVNTKKSIRNESSIDNINRQYDYFMKYWQYDYAKREWVLKNFQQKDSYEN